MSLIDQILPAGSHADPTPQSREDHAANVAFYHEHAARARKVAALVRDIESSMTAQGIVPNADALITLIRMLRVLSPSAWAALFEQAQQREPSMESREAVIAAFEQRLGRLVSR